jgi:hypothetical protein
VPPGEDHREGLSHPAQQHLLRHIPQPIDLLHVLNPRNKSRYNALVLKSNKHLSGDVI